MVSAFAFGSEVRVSKSGLASGFFGYSGFLPRDKNKRVSSINRFVHPVLMISCPLSSPLSLKRVQDSELSEM